MRYRMPDEARPCAALPGSHAAMIAARYGTTRGLARLALAHLQVSAGLAARKPARAADVRRFVFVCQGNICRSAFADRLARDLGFDAISFGLSTDAGKAAHPPALAAAAALGVDLRDHVTRRVQDYVPQPGDLLLAMEVRQLARIAANPALTALPRDLLGRYARPPRPHLHDPFGLGDAYMATCLAVIRSAVLTLAARHPGAKVFPISSANR